MTRRLGVALAAGAAITCGLLFVMQALIATGRGALTERHAAVQIIDFVLPRKQKIAQPQRQKTRKPPDALRQPEMPKATTGQTGGIGVSVSMVRPTAGTTVGISGINIGVADGEYLPIVKVAPVYPPRATAEGLEGYVIVEYTVTKTGMTRDVHVVESTSSVFDRAAIESARKYKYKPRVVNGEPVEVSGVETKITFVLE